MSLIRPFAGLRPAPEYAARVIAPPYDVIHTAEARQLAADNHASFLHISRAEIDLPIGTDHHAATVYAQAATNFATLRAAGVLRQDQSPSFYVYRLTQGVYQQTGLLATVSLADYLSQRVRRHEFTRPDKEDDRLRHMDTLNAQTGPAFLAYPACSELDTHLAHLAEHTPDADAWLQNVRHQLWVVADPSTVAQLQAQVEALPRLYIADGHHRTAAAARLGQARGLTADTAHSYFLAGLFPHNQLRILDYNRVVRDLHGLTPTEFLKALAARGTLAVAATPVAPTRAGEFGIYLGGQWYCWTVTPPPTDDVGARLDVSLLSTQVLAPILGVTDLRRDPRIDFIGGGRGLSALMQAVDSGAMAVAFSLFPTQMADLMAIADQGAVMPPKSTWFEPKLADGLVSHLL
jgi:uncharacterized protein (DUF1015 family)